MDDPALLSDDQFTAEPPGKVLTNRERLELIRELRKRPFKEGDIWLWIPLSWLSDWERMCERQPDDIQTEYRRLDTSSIGTYITMTISPKGPYPIGDSYLVDLGGRIMVHPVVWSRLSDW